MKILVTGGAGFIGGNFVHFMLKEHPQDDILCVDALTYAGNMETLAPVMGNPHFKFIKADIADREAIYSIFEQEKPEIVVNFALMLTSLRTSVCENSLQSTVSLYTNANTFTTSGSPKSTDGMSYWSCSFLN